MSYYNTGAPPVNVPPPQGYGEVFSMLIIITSFVFFVLILPSSLSLFVWFPLSSLSCVLLFCFSMLGMFSRAFGLLCFALERSVLLWTVMSISMCTPDATHCYSQFRSCQGHACMTLYLSVLLLWPTNCCDPKHDHYSTKVGYNKYPLLKAVNSTKSPPKISYWKIEIGQASPLLTDIHKTYFWVVYYFL